MLIETAAYHNRWRDVAPLAKAVFTLAALLTALLAQRPGVAMVVAVVMLLVTTAGAGVALGVVLRVAAPGLLFLLVGSLPLLVSLDLQGSDGAPHWRWAPEMWPTALLLASRASAALLALLFLVLTTPLSGQISLLRRLRVPAVMIDLMVLAYRMLFIFLDTLRTLQAAQRSRLGNSGLRSRLRGLAALLTQLIMLFLLQARQLHYAAQARLLSGSLLFLPTCYTNEKRDTILAAVAGMALPGGAHWLA